MAFPIALFCTFSAALMLIVGEVPAKWPFEPVAKGEQPVLYWGIIGLLVAIGLAAWCRVAMLS